jgi:hypothetical protein
MTNKSDESKTNPKADNPQSQNNFDHIVYERLHKIFGTDYEHPFDDGIERTMSYLMAFFRYIRNESPAETNMQSKFSGLIAQRMEVEIADRDNPGIFYDFFTGKTIFHLPRKPNETEDEARARQFQALKEMWPSMRTGNIQVAAEIIRMLGPHARQKLLQKYSCEGANDENVDSPR